MDTISHKNKITDISQPPRNYLEYLQVINLNWQIIFSSCFEGFSYEVEEFERDEVAACSGERREDERVLTDGLDLREHHHQDDAVDDDAEDRQERQKYLQLK